MIAELLLPLAAALAAPNCPAALRHDVRDITGGRESLCDYAGKVLLVVNTASYCGYTPQYKGLQALQERYKAKGFTVLGFPSNDFGNQEPGSEKEVAEFCDNTYKVRFPMFAKTAVKAPGGSAFYDGLASATGQRPEWNFHKYLVSRDGKTVLSFKSDVEPESPAFVAEVEKLLAARR
jgi:glutathione peroxidase